MPIFQAHCIPCHALKPRKGGLDLTSRDGVLQGSASGPVVVSGKVEASLLLKLVREGKMPPGKKDRLSAGDVAMIRRWIEAGTLSNDGAKGAGGPSGPTVTQHDVLPGLFQNCTVCHGGRKREGGLDVRSRAAMLKGGKSGPALVSGRPEQSLMLKKVRAGEMPPFLQMMRANVRPLNADQIERLSRWIAQGAPEAPDETAANAAGQDPLVTDKDRSFWSFRLPVPVLAPRMPLKRMEAEVLHDALLQVGDRLDPRPFDPPAPVETRPDGTRPWT